jgi:hypothetical protein
MLVLAVGYGALVRTQPLLTGSSLVDGAMGVGLGLYICSHPAAAAIDILYMDRLVLQRLASEWSDIGWLGLNLLVMVAGCVVTVAGATRFVT